MHPLPLTGIGRPWTTLLLLFCVLASSGAYADGDRDRIADLERRLAASEKQLELLSRHLQLLESPPAAPAAAVTAATATATVGNTPAQTQRLEALEQSVSDIADGLARDSHGDTGAALHGFADVGARTATNRSAVNATVPYTARSGFTTGMIDLFLAPEISDRVRALFEIGIEFGQDNGQPGIDIERGQIGYVFGEYLTGWLGRFHTPYGYWNTAYHHGAQIQTALERPRFLAFEDSQGVLPAHTVGAWGTGSMPLGDGKLAYDVYVGNGSRIQDGFLDINNSGDSNQDKAFGGRLGYQFGNGVSAGIHFLREDVDSWLQTVRQDTTRLQVSGAYGVLDTDNWEGIAEFYHFDDRPSGPLSVGHASNAWFTQLAWQAQGIWVPYGRFEHAGLNQADPYFRDQVFGHGYDREVLGLRYNLTPKSAFKVELNHTSQPDLPNQDFNEARLQYAIRF